MTVLMKAQHPSKVVWAPSEKALQELLQHPINFVLATSLTRMDESKAAPMLLLNQRPMHTLVQSSSWQRLWSSQVLPNGLDNRGTWCYHNSVFQALFHAPQVVDWLYGHRDGCNVVECLTCSLAAFCIALVSYVYWVFPL